MLTRSTSKLILWTLPFVLLTLSCHTATNLIVPDTLSSTHTAVPLIPDTGSLPTPGPTGPQASCPSVLTTIMAIVATPAEYQAPEAERHLVTYQVAGEQITNPIFETATDTLNPQQADLTTQHEIWSYFATLIPEQQRDMIAYYSVLTDGPGNLLAAVSQTNSDPSQWVLEVDIADASDYGNLTFTMIHEFGHLLTLAASQVPPSTNVFNNPTDRALRDQEVTACPNYFPGEGCSRSDSYINQFYQRFWKDIYAEWSQIDQIENERDYYERMSQFYLAYQDRFVTEYAATNPAEDIAETWAYFVLAPEPHGNSIADQKVLFFYEHPELVELRSQILSRLCAVFPSNP